MKYNERFVVRNPMIYEIVHGFLFLKLTKSVPTWNSSPIIINFKFWGKPQVQEHTCRLILSYLYAIAVNQQILNLMKNACQGIKIINIFI